MFSCSSKRRYLANIPRDLNQEVKDLFQKMPNLFDKFVHESPSPIPFKIFKKRKNEKIEVQKCRSLYNTGL